MKTEDEEKTKSTTVKKAKRKMSIFTVFLWLALIVVMSVIVVQGINKTNALEGETRKITVKVDFSEYFEKEGITEETEKVEFISNQYSVGAVKTNNMTNFESDIDGISTFIENEGNIGVYEIEITNEARYIAYHGVNNEYNNLYRYSIESETNEIEYIKNFSVSIYGEKIKEEQDVYEIKLKGPSIITVKVDFSEYFEKEGITEEAKKVEFMRDQYRFDAVKTNNITEENDIDGISTFIENEGNIGVYEIEITNEAKYIVYHFMKFMPYSIESETNEIEYISETNNYGKSIYYGEKIKEDQDVYEVKLKKIQSITVKVDFSDYFEKEGIIEDSDKIYFMENYNNDIKTAITNNITESFELDIYISKFISNEDNIGIYQVEVYPNMKYIVYNSIYKIPYSIESKTNGVENIYDSVSDDTYCGEKIEKGLEVYEVKLKKIQTETRKITIKVNFSEYFENMEITDDDEKLNIMRNYNIYVARFQDVRESSDWGGQSLFITNEGNIGIYEIEVKYGERYIAYHKVNDSKYEHYSIENSINKIEYVQNLWNGTYYGEKIKEDQDIYEVKISSSYSLSDIFKIETTYIYKQAKWIDKENRIASIRLGYTFYIKPARLYELHEKVYIDTLGKEFELSPEYYTKSEWSILDTVSDEKSEGIGFFKNIPKYVQNEFDFGYPKKKYVYVKDTKTIYWLDEVSEKRTGNGDLAITGIDINVIYNKEVNKSIEAIVETNKEAKLYYNDYGNMTLESYNISSPSLKYIHKIDGIIKVSKIVENEIGENKYYVGVFENDRDGKTVNVYEINTKDGKGDIAIEIPEYDKEKEYYIYEVDENGNKIGDENIYSSNKMEFESIKDSKITTDESIISSVISDYFRYPDSYYDEEKDEWISVNDDNWHEDEDGNKWFETDEKDTHGTSKIDYTDNILTINEVYQASVTITSKKEEDKEEKYKVEYVAEEGGIVNGETSEIVNPGDTPSNVPTAKADDGYRFIRWEVEENGERIEINPSEYVIEKDTVFYAIFEKIEVVDTSDISIWIYVGVIVVAVIVAIVTIIIIKKNKNKK